VWWCLQHEGRAPYTLTISGQITESRVAEAPADVNRSRCTFLQVRGWGQPLVSCARRHLFGFAPHPPSFYAVTNIASTWVYAVGPSGP
jgi:hypothetical protein